MTSRSDTTLNCPASGVPLISHGLPDSICARRSAGASYIGPNARPSVVAVCNAIGTPVTFISSNGPMPMPNAFFAASSIVAVSATPSSSMRTASVSHGRKNRLTMKP